MTALSLDRERHADWLRTRGREEVGIPGKSCECPVARWIRAEFNTSWPQVMTDDKGVYITFLGCVGPIKADRHSWLYRYIVRLDCEPPMPIRADRALQILDEDEDWHDA
jgi:hypothetical protein